MSHDIPHLYSAADLTAAEKRGRERCAQYVRDHFVLHVWEGEPFLPASIPQEPRGRYVLTIAHRRDREHLKGSEVSQEERDFLAAEMLRALSLTSECPVPAGAPSMDAVELGPQAHGEGQGNG